MRKKFTLLFIFALFLQATTGLGNIALPMNEVTVLQADEIQFSVTTESDRILLSGNVFHDKSISTVRIYRSYDGKKFNSVFTSSSNTISYTDYSAQSRSQEMVYYKVKAYFRDGSTLESSVKEINVNEARSLKPIVITSGGQINIEFFNAKDASVTAQVFNTTSRLLKQDEFQPYKGTNQITMDGSNLRSGMYFLRLEQNGKVTTTKFFIR